MAAAWYNGSTVSTIYLQWTNPEFGQDLHADRPLNLKAQNTTRPQQIFMIFVLNKTVLEDSLGRECSAVHRLGSLNTS